LGEVATYRYSASERHLRKSKHDLTVDRAVEWGKEGKPEERNGEGEGGEKRTPTR